MTAVLQPEFTVGKNVKITTKRKRWHWPEPIVPNSQLANRTLAGRGDIASMLKMLNVTKSGHYWSRNQCGRLNAEDAKKLNHVEKQNLQLKKLLA